jgi:hypothetical protein
LEKPAATIETEKPIIEIVPPETAQNFSGGPLPLQIDSTGNVHGKGESLMQMA